MLLLLGALFALLSSPALGYMEPNTLTGTSCGYCHPSVWVDPPGFWDTQRRPDAGGDCDACHGGYTRTYQAGPHGNYTATSSRCQACHTAHDASGSLKLLPADTIVATCFSCHDGTGGYGVYGTIEARGLTVGGGHSYEETAVIPGGDAATGGSATRTFEGPGGTLICSDCHSPHGQNVVNAFKGDRRRVRVAESPSMDTPRLLRQRPTGAAFSVTDYGSDWCLTCHAGRDSGGAVHNHPVESSSTVASPYTYDNIPILASDEPTSVTVVAPMGGVYFAGGAHWVSEPDAAGNRGYLMPYPRTAQQSGHYPICQQCHEDSREVGTLSADGSTGDAATSTITAADSVQWSSGWVTVTVDNPRFQNFPHETENANMLVETGDDLCLNCHAPAALP